MQAGRKNWFLIKKKRVWHGISNQRLVLTDELPGKAGSDRSDSYGKVEAGIW